MIVFENTPGQVVRMDDPAVQTAISFVRIADTPLDFDTRRALVTRLTISQRVNAQFLHSLGAAIYVYVFGDRIGSIGLSGLTFAGQCLPGSTDVHGVENVLAWYGENKLSRRGVPLRVLVGNVAIEGVATEMFTDIVDPSAGIVQWNVGMQLLPED